MQRCPRCLRANPTEASFCHYDGIPLDTVHLTGSDQFSAPWRFKSGRTCRTLEELAKGCLAEWDEARNALIRQEFVRFFQENNRTDLLRLVPRPEPDADVALHTFLERLPVAYKVHPALDVTPRRIHVPGVRRGEERKVIVTMVNRGTGLLIGDLTFPDNPAWLRAKTTHFKARLEQPIELTIDTRAVDGQGSHFGRMQVRSNGGTVEVPIQVDVVVRGASFQGFSVADPQDLARIMLAHPKQAARWLADGSVAQLFAAEGWPFPIVGPVAPSLGGVQQYFESLGLSTVPAVTPDVAEFELTLEYPEVATRAVTLSVPNKKWVYAFVESGALWLRPREAAVSGARQVDVVFDIDTEAMEPGRLHEAVLQLTTNGGVEHPIWVRVDVRRPNEPWTRKILKPFTG